MLANRKDSPDRARRDEDCPLSPESAVVQPAKAAREGVRAIGLIFGSKRQRNVEQRSVADKKMTHDLLPYLKRYTHKDRPCGYVY